MCGIFFYKSKGEIDKDLENKIRKHFQKIKHRGPDKTSYICENNYFIGFHRLAINGLDEGGDQPFEYDREDESKVFVICNGEIYNWKSLNSRYNLGLDENGSDCSVLFPLYEKFGIEKMVELLDGVFSFIIIDGKKIIAARDPIGVRPLFYGKNSDSEIAFCSEAKGIVNLMDVEPFPPGSYWTSERSHPVKYFSIEEWRHSSPNPYLSLINDKEISESIVNVLTNAVRKRMLSERPIGCLLSGGLDSSLVASILQKELGNQKLNTYSIGFKGSPDLVAARQVAEHIGSNHNEVLLNWKEISGRLPEIIMQLETFDTTTIRASVGMFFLSEYISKNTDDIVIFSGEGADELCQGYLYFHRQPNENMGYMESMRLMDNLYMYDVLRADRTTAAHGLEVRVPFLDKDFMKLIVSLSPKKIAPKNGIEKYIIRRAFAKKGLLPDDVLWRKKEAFSDGVSSEKKNWLLKLQKLAKQVITQEDMDSNILHCKPRTTEECYYRKVFDAFYRNGENWIKDFWMPKWSPETIDPSARTLTLYSDVATISSS